MDNVLSLKVHIDHLMYVFYIVLIICFAFSKPKETTSLLYFMYNAQLNELPSYLCSILKNLLRVGVLPGFPLFDRRVLIFCSLVSE